MSGSFELTPGGGLVIVKDGRTVLDTSGKLINLLPASYDLDLDNQDFTYPDPPNDVVYLWEWASTWLSGSTSRVLSKCDVSITRTPQEWSKTTVLGAAPTGADFLASKVRITRPTAPTHTWSGQSVDPKIPLNKWIPFSGSILLEAVMNMSRATSLYIDGSGDVILHQEQSVGPAPGGYGSWGDPWPPSSGDNGFTNYSQTNNGFVVYNPTGANYHKSTQVDTQAVQQTALTHDMGGPDECKMTDPTNYKSIYRMDFRIAFGKYAKG
jgi:hypothetical protein